MTIQIKDLDESSRPRELALNNGIDSLSNVNLLALILGSGIKGKSVIDISNEILKKYSNLSELTNINYNDLKKIKGLSNAQCLKLIACFELCKRIIGNVNELNRSIEPRNIYKEFINEFGINKNETLYLYIYKNNIRISKNKIVTSSKISVILSFDDISERISQNKGDSFLIVHTHFSENSEPSNEDILATNQLIEISKNLKCNLIDHIIVSKFNYFSFKENGLI